MVYLLVQYLALALVVYCWREMFSIIFRKRSWSQVLVFFWKELFTKLWTLGLCVVAPVAKPTSATVELKQKAVSKSAVKTVQNLTNEQEFQDLELSSMRRTIAKRLTASKVSRNRKLSFLYPYFFTLYVLKKFFSRLEFRMRTAPFVAKLIL